MNRPPPGRAQPRVPPSRELSRRLPSVAVVGRPNVGKSTLVNRIIGRREAIVEHQPGVTRDRKEWTTDHKGMPFCLVDTGGWLPDNSGGNSEDSERALNRKVSAQSRKAILDSDVVVLVVDVTTGVTETDAEVSAMLQKRTGPVLLAVNKVDDEARLLLIWEFLKLGLGDPHPISSLHGRGTADLLDAVVDCLGAAIPPAASSASTDAPPDVLPAPDVSPDAPPVPDVSPDAPPAPDAPPVPPGVEDFSTVSVAIVGRPNVGKSTLFNRLVGSERSVTHEEAGTTRDSVDTLIRSADGIIRLVDTAGLRRRSKVSGGTEHYAALRALRSVDRADVVLFVIAAPEGVTHQDQRLAERVDAAGCPVVVLLNKWDELSAAAEEDPAEEAVRRLHFLSGSPVLRISALTGRGVHRILPALSEAVARYQRRIPTQAVNKVIRQAQASHPAPAGGRVLYATQGATDPPTFTLFVNRELPRTYLRFLERRLREEFDLGGSPVKLHVRRR